MTSLPDLDALPLPALLETLLADGCADRLIAIARDEDLGRRGDATTASLPELRRTGAARLVAREPGVAAGLPLIGRIARAFDAALAVEIRADEGEACRAGAVLARITGPIADLLAVERTLLNLVARAGGVATMTRRFVEAAGPSVKVCGTRKTTPGLRWLEKYAIRCGGGSTHRMGLDDALLYKDNHLAALDPGAWSRRLAEAIAAGRAAGPLRFAEVEVDRIEQLDALLALPAGTVDLVLLDNMAPPVLAEAVARRDRAGSSIALEASGGITLGTIAAVAATGVERISVGAVTHGAVATDLALDLEA